MNWYRRWKDRRHRCKLPPVPKYDNEPEVTIFICDECRRRWFLEWVEDIIEPTIAQPIDIGFWEWRTS